MPAARLRLSGLVARQSPGSGGTPARGWLHNALNPTPFGFASRLCRESRHSRWSHQIPLSGNPHQVLAPSGFTSRLRRETRLQRWIHRKAQLLAALDSPQGAALGTEVAHEGNPPAALDSPDAWLSGDPPAAGCRHLLQYWLPNAVPPEKLTRVRFNGLGL
jgi:hypothetical protein